MHRARFKAPSSHPFAYYHCVSRIVNRDFVLGEAEKAQFSVFMRLYEQLYGLRVVVGQTNYDRSRSFHSLLRSISDSGEKWGNSETCIPSK